MGSKFDFSSLSSRVNQLPETNIVEVAKYGWGRQGLIPLWFGEGDVPTPSFISDACHDAMIQGDTFYTDQNGELAFGGGTHWNGETTSIAAWGSEAGEDNGFQSGEEYTWGVYNIDNE